jgi:hypothetical protein
VATEPVVHLQSLRRRALGVLVVRGALAGLGVVAAVVAGASRTSALLACGGSAVVLLAAAFGDPRSRLHQVPDDPPDAPAGALEDGVARCALAASLPSTIGVAAILVVSLFFEPTLAAVMAGILAGLGAAAAIGSGALALLERRTHRRLFVVRATREIVARRAT